MTQVSPSRPDQSEFAPFYAGYVQSVPDGNLYHFLTTQLGEAEALLDHLDDEQSRARCAPGKWSVKEVLEHISDTERIMSYRLLRVARGDATPLHSFDQDAYVRSAESDLRPIRELLEGFRTVRASTLSLMRGLDQTAWDRSGVASNSPVSARALAYIIAGHAAHHLRVLREQYGLTAINRAATQSLL